HPRLRDLPWNDTFVVADDAEAVAKLRRDMEHRLARADHRNIDQRAAAIDAEVERAERHHRIVTLLLGADEGIVIVGRDQLDLGWAQYAERPQSHTKDHELDLSRGKAFRGVLAQLALRGRVVADDE